MYLNHVSYTFRYVKDELVSIGLYVEELKACKSEDKAYFRSP